MSEKEIKKIDESSEEKVSGGSKILKDYINKHQIATFYGGPQILKYGGPCIFPKKPPVVPKDPQQQPPVEPLTPEKPETPQQK